MLYMIMHDNLICGITVGVGFGRAMSYSPQDFIAFRICQRMSVLLHIWCTAVGFSHDRCNPFICDPSLYDFTKAMQ